MKRAGLILSLFLWAIPSWSADFNISITENLSLQGHLPSERWEVECTPPEFLVQESAEHLEHELKARGELPGEGKIIEAARKRLAVNEAFVCNTDSQACLLVDFSPLRQGEKAPGKETISRSAQYAGQSLEQEEGVDEVTFVTTPFSLTGAGAASRIDAEFQQHQRPQRFVGIVGFSSPYWFYLYYTDYLRDKSDLQEMEEILKSMSISRQP